MAELSRPWSGIVTGDAGPYSDDQWTDAWKTVGGPVIASQGAFRDQLNEFLATIAGAVSPVTIATGRAMVNGIWYESNTTVDIAIPTPGANPRVDRIVLRADWAAQTVRLTRVAGAEGATPVPPALVQNDGVTWDLPLWQVFITVGAALSHWRDERSFIGQYVPTGLTDDRVYFEEEFFLPATAMGDGERFASFAILISASGVVNVLTTFGRGAATLRITGLNATNVTEIRSRDFRPELINAHLVWRSKQPNTHAELDRVLGFLDSALSLTPNNGVFFRADGAANWFAVTRAGGVETATDTGQALDNAWRTFEIRQPGSILVSFLIDGVVVATHQTNIPAADLMLRAGIMDSGAGTAAVNNYLDVDYARVQGDR